MRKVIGVLSGKGGVGKTTVTINLGLAAHRLGEDIMVLDYDLKNPNFGLHLGALEYDTAIHDVLERGMSIMDALHVHGTGLRYIPAHFSLHYMNVDSSNLKNVLEDFNFQVLVDSPPGLGNDALAVLEACDEALIVTTPQLPDLTDCLKTIQVARDMGVGIRGVILNAVRGKGYEITAKEVEAACGTKVLQSVPWDENVLRSLAIKRPVVDNKPHARATIAFNELASRMTGREWSKPKFLRIRRLFSTKA